MKHAERNTSRHPGPVGDEGRNDDESDLRNLRVLEALYHEAGLIAEEDPGPPNTEEQRSIDSLGRFIEHLVKTPPRLRRR